jgi:hypothetical protein
METMIDENIIELHYSLVNHVSNEVIYDLYVFGTIMKHWILREFDITLNYHNKSTWDPTLDQINMQATCEAIWPHK